MLVGPVFSAGSVTSERERQTLDLLLTTVITPWQILWGKLLAGLRVSSVLTMFLLWPVLLACVMVDTYWQNLPAVGGLLPDRDCSPASTRRLIALFCSVVFQKTSISLMTTYLIIILLFLRPVAGIFFARTFYADTQGTLSMEMAGVTSPFVAAFSTPLHVDTGQVQVLELQGQDNWLPLGGYVLFTLLLSAGLLGTMTWLFKSRWRVAT